MGNNLARDAPDGGLTKKELERMHRRLAILATLVTLSVHILYVALI